MLTPLLIRAAIGYTRAIDAVDLAQRLGGQPDGEMLAARQLAEMELEYAAGEWASTYTEKPTTPA